MFEIFEDGVLIGRSELEGGDPPMGVAAGRFVPTDAFVVARRRMTPDIRGDGSEDNRIRCLRGLRAKTGDGVDIECLQVIVFEVLLPDGPEWEVHCDGIPYPLYEELFPGAYKAYEDYAREQSEKHHS